MAALIAVSLSMPIYGAQAQLVLSSGSLVQGEILESAPSLVRLSQLFDAPDGLVDKPIGYPRSMVSDIVDLEPEYQKRLAQATETPDDQAALADWCRWAGFRERALTHARRAFSENPNHILARRVLGQFGLIVVNGGLVSEMDYLSQNQLAHFGGGLVPISDRAKLQQAEEDDVTARHAALEEGARLEKAHLTIASKQRQVDAVDQRLAELKEPTSAQMQAAKQAIDQAQKQIDAANRPRGTGRHRYAPGPDSRQLDALKQARALSASLDAQRSAIQQERTLQSSSKQSLQQELTRLQADLPALEQQADKATRVSNSSDQAFALLKSSIPIQVDPRLVAMK